MARARPAGTIQIDVDDLWVYYESIGRPTPADAPPVAFTQGVPRLLDLFDHYGIRGTFFICGRDLPPGPAGAVQREVVAELVRRGHEAANHSATHRNGYARLERDALWADVAEAHERIGVAAGVAPVGFKAPGFSYNRYLPDVLAGQGYLYDSSLLPTPYAPLVRAAQRVLSGGRVDPTHYGKIAYGLAPLAPYHPDPDRPYRPASGLQSGLLEVPVTTVPGLRLPMHSTFVMSAGRWLFNLGVGLLRGGPVNYLLHAADVVDPVSDEALASYKFLVQRWEPAENGAGKRRLYEHLLGTLSAAYNLVPTREYVDGLGQLSS